MKDQDQNDSNMLANIGRRGFMRRAGVGAGAVAAGSALGTAAAATPASGSKHAAKTRGVDYDVIVLGGGFAGVTAARDSSKNGYKTLLLEARDRLGGRTWTKEFSGHKVEMGGTWIHWTQPFVWAEVQRYKLDVVETPKGRVAPGVEIRILVEGRCEILDKPEQIGPVIGVVNKYFADARRYWERPYDASFRWNELLKGDKLSALNAIQDMSLTPVQRVALEAYAAGLSHGPLDQVSHLEVNRWWALPGGSMTALHDSCGRYTFKEGTISLIRKMVEDGKVEARLSTPVTAVDDKGDHVVVTTAGGQRLTAAAVIVGLPMNVVHRVQFTPALDPLVAEAGRERHAGTGIKLLIRVKGRLSQTHVTALAPPTHPFSFVTTYVMAEDHTILVMFGPDPKRIDYSDTAAVQQALRDFFPDVVVEALDHHSWTDDQYARGTWCNYKPGWFAKYHDRFQKDRGRVVFGQGDHGEGWRGFIDGAIGAGMGAANRVKTKLG
ncbi:flavin monoamine oxidase family protein [Massilia cavernae]|uniref:FAD-dependent oxidoreductase n=1 Tax=Massilia cavernae TaxID=2320864 RepID=A0A418Y7R8_9BURK|nr:NAD(P)/FAD-dependent oxidoreductase [Massilia cavernae]RJG26437.1 FAD-dependent oxidoreductase [Massilia cavernae]